MQAANLSTLFTLHPSVIPSEPGSPACAARWGGEAKRRQPPYSPPHQRCVILSEAKNPGDLSLATTARSFSHHPTRLSSRPEPCRDHQCARQKAFVIPTGAKRSGGTCIPPHRSEGRSLRPGHNTCYLTPRTSFDSLTLSPSPPLDPPPARFYGVGTRERRLIHIYEKF